MEHRGPRCGKRAHSVSLHGHVFLLGPTIWHLAVGWHMRRVQYLVRMSAGCRALGLLVRHLHPSFAQKDIVCKAVWERSGPRPHPPHDCHMLSISVPHLVWAELRHSGGCGPSPSHGVPPVGQDRPFLWINVLAAGACDAMPPSGLAAPRGGAGRSPVPLSISRLLGLLHHRARSMAFHHHQCGRAVARGAPCGGQCNVTSAGICLSPPNHQLVTYLLCQQRVIRIWVSAHSCS